MNHHISHSDTQEPTSRPKYNLHPRSADRFIKYVLPRGGVGRPCVTVVHMCHLAANTSIHPERLHIGEGRASRNTGVLF